MPAHCPPQTTIPPEDRVRETVRRLPPEEAESVLDFAAYLLTRVEAEEHTWDEVADRADPDKLKSRAAQVRQAEAEGHTAPLDLDRL